MPIVSLSLNERILQEIDKLEKSLGFSGRSEVMRAAVRHFITEKEEANAITGRINAVILATHSQDSDNIIASATHKFDDIIVTHLHNKAESERCLETFILKGDASRVKEMFKALQSNRKADYVKLLVF